MITNKFNLPETFVNALKREGKHKKAYASATELLKSPRQFHLANRHAGETEEDVTDRIWMLLGTGLHYVLEKGEGKNDLVEQYLTADVMGEKISGFCDHYSNGTITDYKTTSVWSVIYKSSEESWEQQLNIYSYLYRMAGFEVDKLQIVAILRDWQKTKAKFDPNYPQIQVQTIELKLWSVEKQKQFIEDKIKSFKACEDAPDNDLPFCTEKERWYTGDKWAIKKKGLKRALKLYDSAEAAENALQEGQEIEFRKGESKKCDYCQASQFCNQKGI